jgi:ABC-2 type transport system permease protein
MSYVYAAPRQRLRERLAYQARIVGVIARTEFKVKYAGSVLGYIWSLGKPLLYFGVLYVVFSGLFKTTIPHFPVYLLIGIVLFTFFSDSVTASLPSIVARGPLLRRISFPPVVIPVAATLTAAMTFALNCIAVVIFIAAAQIAPDPSWLLLIPLALELYLFAIGLALIVSSLYVRLRDIGHIWEVFSSVLFFSTPIMYPVSILPTWAQHVIAFNPLVQVIQDARSLVLGPDALAQQLLGAHGNHLAPLCVLVVVVVTGVRLQRRESSRFAELA